VVAGSVALVVSLGFGIAGTTLAIAQAQARDQAGFVMSDHKTFQTVTYAITSDNVQLPSDPAGAFLPRAWLGEAKVTASSLGGRPVFIGVAATRDALAYLNGVSHATVVDPGSTWRGGRGPVYRTTAGDAPDTAPATRDIWVAQSTGADAQTLVWPIESGDWTLVLMNADGSAGVTADLAAGATVPALTWIVGILLSIAGTSLVVGVALLVISVRAARTPSPMAPQAVAAS
jgi:hypothetical protein